MCNLQRKNARMPRHEIDCGGIKHIKKFATYREKMRECPAMRMTAVG